MQWGAVADATGQPVTRGCVHTDQLPTDLAPRSITGCEECLRSGTDWVHLRECAACGHVGCCDDSPRRHASAHNRTTAHPVIRSLQPAERWGWCYSDELFLAPAELAIPSES